MGPACLKEMRQTKVTSGGGGEALTSLRSNRGWGGGEGSRRRGGKGTGIGV